MEPTLRASFLGLLLVSLFPQCESGLASSEVEKEHRELRSICGPNGDDCRKSCPVGWMYYEDYCYGLFEDHMTWADAEVHCQGVKSEAHLASFSNQKELKKMAKYISTVQKGGGHVWIGLYDPAGSRYWKWTDLSFGSYYPWDDGEPNDTNERCVHLAAHKGFEKLNDAFCQLEMPYICKYHL
ncbi:C-type lection lectoxin-Enh3-like [Heteronotia binoei]|uniref:C-type lection lectoxin-Enh3-like n=1 Tax=Heteronotia binoei TaxID=13085 RepID=UPI00292DFAFD|nr:C-type lection lectoxin-Enh3-like [Heteronotia binoei]